LAGLGMDPIQSLLGGQAPGQNRKSSSSLKRCPLPQRRRNRQRSFQPPAPSNGAHRHARCVVLVARPPPQWSPLAMKRASRASLPDLASSSCMGSRGCTHVVPYSSGVASRASLPIGLTIRLCSVDLRWKKHGTLSRGHFAGDKSTPSFRSFHPGSALPGHENDDVNRPHTRRSPEGPLDSNDPPSIRA